MLRRAQGRVSGIARVSGPRTSLVLRTQKQCSPSCDINSPYQGCVVESSKLLTSAEVLKRAEGQTSTRDPFQRASVLVKGYEPYSEGWLVWGKGLILSVFAGVLEEGVCLGIPVTTIEGRCVHLRPVCFLRELVHLLHSPCSPRALVSCRYSNKHHRHQRERERERFIQEENQAPVLEAAH